MLSFVVVPFFLSVSVGFCPFWSISVGFCRFWFVSVSFSPFLSASVRCLSVLVRFCPLLSVVCRFQSVSVRFCPFSVKLKLLEIFQLNLCMRCFKITKLNANINIPCCYLSFFIYNLDIWTIMKFGLYYKLEKKMT